MSLYLFGSMHVDCFERPRVLASGGNSRSKCLYFGAMYYYLCVFYELIGYYWV